jgi:hypothetical protein
MRAVLSPHDDQDDRCVATASTRPARRMVTGMCLLLIAPVLAAAGESGPVRFSRDVLPILSENCLLCHGPDAKARKADLRLDVKDSALRSKDPIIVPGKSVESELIHRIQSTDPDEIMPPPKSGRTLTQKQKETLKQWVDQGAAWGKHWAFEPPTEAERPSVKNSAWVRNPIDAFVLARLEQEGLRPSPEADRATLIRRLGLDLTGLPPTLAEVDAFVSSQAPHAYEDLVDRLLASAHYGERMAMDWLDAARYADTNGYQNDFARTMWPWRDWVIAAFNRNQPFDRFLVDQIAGDLLPAATREQKVATGFNRNNRTVTEAGSIEEEWRIENAVDRVETTATVFLGLTMGCARCHDHKFDPITQTEFYQFLAFFNSTSDKGVYTEQRGNVPPMTAVPGPSEEKGLSRLDADIAGAIAARKAAESTLPERQKRWERGLQGAAELAEPRDWAVRCPLDGSLHFQGSSGETIEGQFRGQNPPAWCDGPQGKAIRLEGQDRSYVEVERGASLDRTDRFSYGAWIRPRGNGAVLSKMDDQGAYRGYDLLIQNDKLQVHLVHAWPADALKVATRQSLPRDAWTHVFITHDGSGKASGLKVYLNGRPVDIDVESDTLRGTTVTGQPLRLGKRSTALPLTGDLADVRIYRRMLSAEEIRELAAVPFLAIARSPEPDRSTAQQAQLARYFKEEVDPEFRQADARLALLRKQRSELEATIPTVMVMEDLPAPRPAYLLKRGRYDMPDTTRKLDPGVPGCLGARPSTAPRNRLGLARWLASPTNPLTARVALNRLWQQHFGTGLVKTTENFGLQSEPPSHPALLDWLAAEFVRSGWDVKAMHRLIVTSATYRQESKAPASLIQHDPENRLLARGPRFRLPAELVRDNALAIAGLLSNTIGGPSVKPYQPEGLWEELAGGAGEAPYVQDKGDKLYRRSLYVYRKRTVPHPAMATFDAPSRETCQVKRARTNTPLQALELLNDITYVEAAAHLARLMMAEGGRSPQERVRYAFRRATSRSPSPAELQIIVRGLNRYRESFQAHPELASQWMQQGPGPVLPGLETVELAAYIATASVILNLDETITGQ